MTSPEEIRRLKRAASRKKPPVFDLPQLEVPGGIVQFATDPEFMGCDLFPRQGTLLKLMTLDVPNMTDFDYEVIEEWMAGFVLDTDEFEYRGREGTPPDLFERIEWCRSKGLSWFRNNVLVIGRRGSKNFCASIMVAWLAWKLVNLGDPQDHYQLPPDKPIQILFVGTDLEAVKKNAFGDTVNMFRNAECLRPFLGASTSTMLSILTRAQLESGARPGVDVGTIQIIAAPTTATSGRGPAVICIVSGRMAPMAGTDCRFSRGRVGRFGRGRTRVMRYRTPRSAEGAEIRDVAAGGRSSLHRGSGFGPVAVTSCCGTQSSTWVKPSKRPSSASTTSKKDRR